jgi:hypothetical protein
MRRLVLIVGLTAVACVHDDYVWHNDAKSKQEFYQDKTKCRVAAEQACPKHSAGNCWETTFNECLMGEGWEQRAK